MAQAGVQSYGTHHPTTATREGQLDGKSSSANEIYADESGGASGDEGVSIEEIEKVYR